MMKNAFAITASFLALLLLALASCSNKIEYTDVVFKNVNLIPMTGEKVIPGCSVYVAGGKIKAAGKLEELNAPSSVKVLDASGKYLVPGFGDMHVHARHQEEASLFLANGVTLLRNMSGYPQLLEYREKIRRKEFLGPEIFTTGPLIDGPQPVWPDSFVLADQAQVTAAIKKMKDDGYDAIKVYDKLSLPVYDAIIKSARELGLPVVGHVPLEVGLKHVIESGQQSIEHFTGYAVLDESEEIINLPVQSGVWNCPTMSIRPKSVLLKTLYDRGARIVSGTDTGAPIGAMIAGFSLHEEFELMQEAGLAPYQVLLTTTVNPARMLGIENRLGTIDTGKDADLVLLDKNPLEDIKNTRVIAGVMVKGTWLPKEKLAQMLAEVKRKMMK